MRKVYLGIACLIFTTFSFSQLNVLVFHKTNGYRHGSISNGISMIEDLGETNDWITSNTTDANQFTTTNLANYDVVVWCNTSGDGLLNANQKAAFQNFIQAGGGFVGIHAATDTYRDKSWSWYNDLVGAIVQTGPNHTSNNYSGTIDVVGNHDIVSHLGTAWSKGEEYYYWELNGGYIFSGNVDLLNVQSTGNNSYDQARPITWYKEYDGGRSFYTALGHNGSDYDSNEKFREMMRKAILWGAGGGVVLDSPPLVSFIIPAKETIELSDIHPVEVDASDSDGSIVKVDLFLDGEYVGTETSVPFKWGYEIGIDPQLDDLIVGNHVLKAVAEDDMGLTTEKIFNITVVEQKPFGGVAHIVPGIIEAEDYDVGGEGISYSDADNGNNGDAYRNDDVDVQRSIEGQEVYNVGWTSDNEWLEYTIDVSSSGIYNVDLLVASQNGGAELVLEIDSVTVGQPVEIDETGGWQNYSSRSILSVPLDSGKKNLKLAVNKGGVNIDKIVFTKQTVTSVEDELYSGLKVFPNPSIGKVTVAGLDGYYLVEVVNVFGNVVYRNETGNSNVTELELFSSGVYTLVFSGNGTVEMRQLVIQ